MKLIEDSIGIHGMMGVSNERGLLIYNKCAEVTLSGEQLMDIRLYLQPIMDICETDGERMYACYTFAEMFFGFASARKTQGQIDTARCQFGMDNYHRFKGTASGGRAKSE